MLNGIGRARRMANSLSSHGLLIGERNECILISRHNAHVNSRAGHTFHKW